MLRRDQVASFHASPEDILKLKYAPIVSVEIVRLFSYLKRVASPQRESFTFEHLKWQLVAMWEQDSGA